MWKNKKTTPSRLKTAKKIRKAIADYNHKRKQSLLSKIVAPIAKIFNPSQEENA